MSVPQQQEIYVRVKRHHQTFFVHAERSVTTMLDIKAHVSRALNTHGSHTISSQSMKLYNNTEMTTELSDNSTLTDCGIQNDDILYVVFPLKDENDAWEDVDIHIGPDGGTESVDLGQML
eukprot:scaffold2127_cov43-Attheya_sp.AAC.1